MMTDHNSIFFFIPLVHGAPVAIFESGTVFADPGFTPRAIPHDLIFVIPHFKKIIVINVSFDKVSVDVRAGSYRSVFEN